MSGRFGDGSSGGAVRGLPYHDAHGSSPLAEGNSVGKVSEARLNGETCWAAGGGGGHACRESGDGGGGGATAADSPQTPQNCAPGWTG